VLFEEDRYYYRFFRLHLGKKVLARQGKQVQLVEEAAVIAIFEGMTFESLMGFGTE
jgi:hypothetical protein